VSRVLLTVDHGAPEVTLVTPECTRLLPSWPPDPLRCLPESSGKAMRRRSKASGNPSKSPRGKAVTPKPRSAPKAVNWMILPLRILYFEDLSVGLTEVISKTISSADVVGFAQLTGDRNPIHLSEHFAAKTSFGSRIAHGLYTASLISAVLGTRLPGPGAVYISQTLHFRAPVRIGDTVDVTVTVVGLNPERQRATLTCICRVGNEVVLEGEALVKVPSAIKSKRPLPRL